LANSYFQFKKFRVEQANCSMKVSTDACILGAYAPVENTKRIIDIGTGTGLLALMAAQRSKAQIDAIEIEKEAAKQAEQNCKSSSWAENIQVFCTTIQDFAATKAKDNLQNLYELAICNPPFFNRATLPTSKAQQLAHHTIALPFADLWAAADLLLAEEGKFIVLLPLPEMQLFEQIGLQHEFVPNEIITIQDSEKHKPHRKIIAFCRQNHQSLQGFKPKQKILLIKNLDGSYTQDFVNLLQPYYLYL
jgi:tRNA1Val (adenine37-N6)-methyltransferase